MFAHRVFVGTIGEGVFRSLDGGATFARAMEGMFVESHIRALVVDRRDPELMYLGAESGLYRSSDGASNWSRVDSPLNGRQIWSILQTPLQPDTLLVGTCPSQVFVTRDAGRTWIHGQASFLQDCPRIIHTRLTSLLGDPENPEHFWAGVEIDGLYRSRDGGRSWQKEGQGLSSQDIHALAWLPGRVLLAATNNDLNRSGDGGDTWQPLRVEETLPWSYCRSLGQPVNDPGTVFLGNGNGPPGSAGVIARSTDLGKSFAACTMPGHANSTIWNFAVHAADPMLIYASSVSGQVYRSWDGGMTWEKLPREFGEIRALAWTPR